MAVGLKLADSVLAGAGVDEAVTGDTAMDEADAAAAGEEEVEE